MTIDKTWKKHLYMLHFFFLYLSVDLQFIFLSLSLAREILRLKQWPAKEQSWIQFNLEARILLEERWHFIPFHISWIYYISRQLQWNLSNWPWDIDNVYDVLTLQYLHAPSLVVFGTQEGAYKMNLFYKL